MVTIELSRQVAGKMGDAQRRGEEASGESVIVVLVPMQE